MIYKSCWVIWNNPRSTISVEVVLCCVAAEMGLIFRI